MVSKFKDKILFLKLQDKDREAFVRAYDLYLDNIYRFIYFKLNNNREEAEDLTSSVFLKAWDYIQNNNLDNSKSIKSLFYKIARNSVIDHYRQNKERANIVLENCADKLVIDEANNPHKIMELTADLEMLQKFMQELKDEYREIITLRYLNELSIAEIADILDKSKSNVRVLLFRAQNALRKLINQKTNIK